MGRFYIGDTFWNGQRASDLRPKKDVKLKDVAEELGVSVVSVSNALGGKAGVSDELREKVVACAKQKGLDISAYGKKDEKKKAKMLLPECATIGVVVSERYISIGTSFYWEMYQKTAHEASKKGCVTMLEIADDDNETNSPQMIVRKETDGIIVIGPMREAYLKRLLKDATCPVVFMDQQISDSRYSSVLSGNYYGMYRSTRELVKAGHKEIGFLGSLEDSRNIIDRYYGYKKCMRESGLKVERKWVISDGTGGKKKTEIVLPAELPTAFACCGDFSAGLLYDKLKSRGLRVPEDISLASYDDYMPEHELKGKLTSYHVDIEHMAKCAIKLVLREMEDPSASGVIYEVDSYVVCRSSIAKPVR